MGKNLGQLDYQLPNPFFIYGPHCEKRSPLTLTSQSTVYTPFVHATACTHAIHALSHMVVTCHHQRGPGAHYSSVHEEDLWLGTLPEASSLFQVAHAARASERLGLG